MDGLGCSFARSIGIGAEHIKRQLGSAGRKQIPIFKHLWALTNLDILVGPERVQSFMRHEAFGKKFSSGYKEGDILGCMMVAGDCFAPLSPNITYS